MQDKTRKELFEKKKNTQIFIDQMTALFPDEEDSLGRIFPANKNHWQLKSISNDCLFLSANGCTLPDHARPLFCRIYPFWFFHDQPQIFQDPHCLALQRCKTVPELLLSLGTNSNYLKLIHRQIRQEWGVLLFHVTDENNGFDVIYISYISTLFILRFKKPVFQYNGHEQRAHNKAQKNHLNTVDFPYLL